MRQQLFQLGVGSAVAADQMRRAAARAITQGAFPQGLHHARVCGQAQVIVAVEAEQLTPIHPHPSGASRIGNTARAPQLLHVQLVQSGLQAMEHGVHTLQAFKAATVRSSNHVVSSSFKM